jgi:Gpi18-like mannosyltransferase
LHVGTARLSVMSPWRVLVWAVVLIAIRHALVRRNPLYRRFVAGWKQLRTSAEFSAAWPTFVSTRVAVLLVGYFAVVTIGYPMPTAPTRVSSNEFLNLASRWDTGWYLAIAVGGYRWDPNLANQQSIAFFPAYPMLMRVGGRLLGQQPLLAGVLVSLGSFFVALLYLYRLARERLDHESAVSALVLLAAYPFALFYSAAYTESLFLCGAVAAFYHLRRAEYVKAGLWGLLVGLTRPNGCLLSVPLAALIFEDRLPFFRTHLPSVRTEKPLKPIPALLAASMPGVGMLLFSAYLYALTGYVFAWARAHEAWGRSYKPLADLVVERYRYIEANGWYGYTASLPIDILNGLAALFVICLIWPTTKRLGLAYGLFVAINLFTPLMAGGLLSIGRVTSVLFPIFLWLAQAVPARHRPAWIGAFAMGQALNAALFFTWRPLY